MTAINIYLYYDVGDVAKLMIDVGKGKVNVSFYDKNKKAVDVATATMADWLVKENVSSLALEADDFTVAALDDSVKYLKIETADKTLDSYKLAKLA